MEKFLWNAGGIVLFAMNIWYFMIVCVSNNSLLALGMIAFAAVDWLYKEKRPAWVEV